MSVADFYPLIAADVGNRRVKLGRFEPIVAQGLPTPAGTLSVAGEAADFPQIGQWLSDTGPRRASWWISSVNRPTASRLIDWIRSEQPDAPITLLASGDLPLVVGLNRPDMVGVDRLVDAVAVNRLRDPGRPAVVVDIGSAITVDAISREGVFLGGAIAPGLTMSAQALHTFTDLLPLIEMAELIAPPEPIGAITTEAMRAGLYWGAVGTIRELMARQAERLGGAVQTFLTGGGGPAVAALLGSDVQHIPHLTLAGIALTAAAMQE